MKIFFITIFLGLLSFGNVSAQSDIEVNFFYNKTCPHCVAEKVFLGELEKKNPEIKINQYEISDSAENQKLLQDFYDKYQVPKGEKGWVPITFTPARYFVGFNEQTGKQIENYLLQYSGEQGQTPETLKVTVIGEINPAGISLPLLAIILGALDG